MIRLTFILPLFCVHSIFLIAQSLPKYAQDFSVVDINDDPYRLYELLNSGKSVILDFMTTDCAPCWDYHNQGTLKELYKELGPSGNNTLEIFMVECSDRAGISELRGETADSYGDWVTGTPYPIVDDGNPGAKYSIYKYPSIVLICPDRSYFEIGQSSLTQLYNHLAEKCSESIHSAPTPNFYAEVRVGCDHLHTQFIDQSWPLPLKYEWDFGDGKKSTLASPEHYYENPGVYTVSLKTENEYGVNEVVLEDYISIGAGDHATSQNVGISFKGNEKPFHNIFFGGLVFDVMSPIVLERVDVYSSSPNPRDIITIALLDKDGNVLNQKTDSIGLLFSTVDLDFYIPPGKDYFLTKWNRVTLRSAYRSIPVEFPYLIDEMIEIKSSSGGETRWVEFFFNWAVRKAECNTVGTNSFPNEPNFSLSPNPVEDMLMIDHEQSSGIHASIYNLMGKKIKVIELSRSSKTRINTEDLGKGLYYIEIDGITQSFVKQ